MQENMLPTPPDGDVSNFHSQATFHWEDTIQVMALGISFWIFRSRLKSGSSRRVASRLSPTRAMLIAWPMPAFTISGHCFIAI